MKRTSAEILVICTFVLFLPSHASANQCDAYWDSLYEAALPPIDSDTKWVAVDGDDGNPCTAAAPCATILRALEQIAPRGQVVVKDGNYVDRLGMRINDNTTAGDSSLYGVDIPSGLSRNQRTVVRAETPFGVRITFNGGPFGWHNEWIRLEAASYVWVDGFIVDWLGDSNDPAYMVALGQE